jgi:hypothetical protein
LASFGLLPIANAEQLPEHVHDSVESRPEQEIPVFASWLVGWWLNER